MLGLGNLLRNQPDRDDAAASDSVTEDVLRLFGLPADEAQEICRRPLPDLANFEFPDSRPEPVGQSNLHPVRHSGLYV